MLIGFRKFVNDEEGAVTVDWVVLCAGIVAMAVLIFASLETGTMTLVASITTFLGGQAP